MEAMTQDAFTPQPSRLRGSQTQSKIQPAIVTIGELPYAGPNEAGQVRTDPWRRLDAEQMAAQPDGNVPAKVKVTSPI